ncbi:MarR family winged helix-turn-helix transcriptional regulator [Pleomorphomonas koreensis]|uniref:MarR family winged helix-turn-helix transcriptional regulator n=1 Tax=Pleomorphomonas koreensis TaxID=257440 RepID=UPI00069D9543|nr:MarR family transcriptional regulator [Pleomorphomonas koreensis]
MAAINFQRDAASPSTDSAVSRPDGNGGDGLDLELIELLFFAYRDFVGEADHILEEIGYGRAHHRVVYFVTRHPGLRVSDLLDILQITKQSLGRVLKQLVDDGYIEQRPGPVDRRERLLYASGKGERLAYDLSARQHARVERALATLPSGARALVRDFLGNMIDARAPGAPAEREG